MKRALQLQGGVFGALALACVLVSLWGLRLEPQQELVAVAVVVLLLGMPHGSFDALIARQLLGAVDIKGWALFSLGYVALAAGVVAVWFVAPTVFLGAFLVLSALHFGGDLGTAVPRVTRVLYGGTVVVLPALWHGPELQHLLGLVAGPASAQWITPVLQLLCIPWLVASVLACAWLVRSSRAAAVDFTAFDFAALEFAALMALAVAAPPLVAFALYFCAMHSPRHMLRTLAHQPASGRRPAVVLAVWPTLIVLIAAVLFSALVTAPSLDVWVMQLLFVGLAALTLPHMALLELARRHRAT